MTDLIWSNSKRKVNELIPFERNPRKLTPDQEAKLRESIERFNLVEVPAIDTDNRLLAGHQRMKIMQLLGRGEEEIDVRVPNRKLTQEEYEEYLIRSNKNTGEWDYSLLKLFDQQILLQIGFTPIDLGIKRPEDVHAKLAERFVVPPFSVLDTKQEYWQKRKLAWRELGIESELGREGTESIGSYSGTIPGYYTLKNAKEHELGRPISHAEMEEKYLQEMLDNSNLAFTEGGGILSIFDPVLCEVIYRWFIPGENCLILDPFAGGSVRGIVAGYLGHRYTGIDLSAEQVEANKKQADKILKDSEKVKWIVGDSKNADTLITGEKADLIFSCPPYFDLEKYGADPNDLSNMTWESFRETYREIIKKSCDLLKPNRFACFVVGEVRNREGGGVYRNLIGETINAFVEAGLLYYNEFILLNMLGSTPIRVGKQFNKSRKNGKIHQNVMVFYKAAAESFTESRQAAQMHMKILAFYKGNPQDICQEFKDLDFSGLEELSAGAIIEKVNIGTMNFGKSQPE